MARELSLHDRVLHALEKLLLIQTACVSESDDPLLVQAIGQAAKEAYALLEPVRETLCLGELHPPVRPPDMQSGSPEGVSIVWDAQKRDTSFTRPGRKSTTKGGE